MPAAGNLREVTAPRILDTTARRLLARTAAEQINGRLPSVVAGVVRDGELVWSGSRGAVDSGDGVSPPSADTQYRIGSITKVMTAILVMQLRDEGALHLTDRVGDHLPGVAYGDRSIRELLSHSSGMQAEPPGPWWERSLGVSFASLADRLDDADAALPTGQEYHYSNVAFALLGELVARARGESWASALRSRLLVPLEMNRTTYAASTPAATGFSVDTFTGELTDEPSHDAGAMAPAGQLWSTVADLGRLAGFFTAPDESVLTPDTVAEMTVGQIGIPDGSAAGSYGLGLRLAVANGRSYLGHTGSVPGFLAGMFVDRERGAAGVCVANGGDGLRAQAFPIELMDLLEEHEPVIPAAWAPTVVVPPTVRAVMGLWYWGNTALTIGYEGERIVARMLADGCAGQPWCTFRVDDAAGVRGATGYFTGERLHVVRRPDGTVSHLECATFIFTHRPYDASAPIPH